MAAIMIQLSLILSQSWDEILWLINDLHNKGISWGAVITAVIFWGKLNRNKKHHERDKRIAEQTARTEAKIDAIMERVGVECASLTVTESSTGSFKTSSTSRSAVLSVVRIAKRFTHYHITRRKKLMEKLKSRKLWLAIAGALIPIINQEFALNLDGNIIIGIMGLLGITIAGFAHVDAKQAQNGGTVNEPTKPTGDSGSAV